MSYWAVIFAVNKNVCCHLCLSLSTLQLHTVMKDVEIMVGLQLQDSTERRLQSGCLMLYRRMFRLKKGETLSVEIANTVGQRTVKLEAIPCSTLCNRAGSAGHHLVCRRYVLVQLQGSCRIPSPES